GGPNAWWEANGSGPSSSNPWIGSHAGPQFGACPYGWPISAQQQGLLDWIASGQTISVGNLTNSYNVTSGSRSTYGVSLAVTKPGAGRVITVRLTGTLPGAVQIQLPIF